MGQSKPTETPGGRDLSRPDHLPNLRPGGTPPHPSWLPSQRRGTTPQMIGRYPDYDVLQSVDTWDAATAKVVDARMHVSREMNFFSAAEQSTARLFCDLVTAQDMEPRIPVVELIDEKLAGGRLDGYQYDDMPDDRDTWRLVLAGLDEVATERHGARLADCQPEAAHQVVSDFAATKVSGGSWEKLNVSRAWSVCMRAILAAFYSHPWAWNEIGFGGPAYPQGYMRLGPVSTLEPRESAGATSEDPAPLAQELQG